MPPLGVEEATNAQMELGVPQKCGTEGGTLFAVEPANNEQRQLKRLLELWNVISLNSRAELLKIAEMAAASDSIN